MSEETQATPNIGVLFERLRNIDKNTQAQAHDVKKMSEDISSMKTDLAVFKAKFAIIGVVASAVVSGIVSLVVKLAG